jgi:hypothetical protein|tara:strand:- start:3564 stop:3743 length:180 start_codon:yes stop_codon:yes gene_type:complete
MIIVKDIQDALTLEDLIQGVIRRADGCSKEHVLIELDMICTTLKQNVTRIESEMEKEII